MGFGFGKKKKNISSDTTPAAADIKTTLDEDGNVEIVSKNFKMKPTQKLAEQPSSEGDTRLSFFAALFYFIAMRSLRIAYIYFLYTLLKCDSKSIYYESPRKSCSIQHHCYPYILHRSMPVHPKEHHKAYSCTHQKS